MTHPTAGSALEAYAAALAARDWPGVRAALSDRLVVRLLHTGETFDADGFTAFNRDYPGAWAFHRDEVVDAGEHAVLRSRTVVGAQTWHAASFGRLGDDGRLVELVEVWSEPVGPPPPRP